MRASQRVSSKLRALGLLVKVFILSVPGVPVTLGIRAKPANSNGGTSKAKYAKSTAKKITNVRASDANALGHQECDRGCKVKRLQWNVGSPAADAQPWLKEYTEDMPNRGTLSRQDTSAPNFLRRGL
ncbi:hypothetical protein GOP47_0031148 [Adiantum capillus-veneris]|nr:hypothetical protein GOP47_0031148 [Adiantum capillus-veneris]